MSVENTLLGIVSLARGFAFAFRQLLMLPLFQGFVVGFVLASLLYSFIVGDRIGSVSRLLWGDPAKYFMKTAQMSKDGVYDVSFSSYKKLALRAKIALYVTLVFLFLVTAYALWRYS